MFDIGWPEIFLIGVITLLVVGPKEIPHVLRNVMGWVKKARSLARDFQNGVDDMVREAELDKVKDNLVNAVDGDGDILDGFKDAVDPDGTAEDALDFDMADFEDNKMLDDEEAKALAERSSEDYGIDARPDAMDDADGDLASEPKDDAPKTASDSA